MKLVCEVCDNNKITIKAKKRGILAFICEKCAKKHDFTIVELGKHYSDVIVTRG